MRLLAVVGVNWYLCRKDETSSVVAVVYSSFCRYI
jgi:hypothetical protein